MPEKLVKKITTVTEEYVQDPAGVDEDDLAEEIDEDSEDEPEKPARPRRK